MVNYTDADTPFTRIIEHKHFAFGTQPKTVVTREYPADWQVGGEPYYTVNDEANSALYQKYAALAAEDDTIVFGGRLGEYQYYDMDKVIASALACAGGNWPDHPVWFPFEVQAADRRRLYSMSGKRLKTKEQINAERRRRRLPRQPVPPRDGGRWSLSPNRPALAGRRSIVGRRNGRSPLIAGGVRKTVRVPPVPVPAAAMGNGRPPVPPDPNAARRRRPRKRKKSRALRVLLIVLVILVVLAGALAAFGGFELSKINRLGAVHLHQGGL